MSRLRVFDWILAPAGVPRNKNGLQPEYRTVCVRLCMRSTAWGPAIIGPQAQVI